MGSSSILVQEKINMAGMRESHNSNMEWVRLNVGGTVFLTTKSTLTKFPETMLHRLCQDNNELGSDKDESGAIIIDRDPMYFVPVLNYLRHGKLIIEKNLTEEGVSAEADFYGMTGLSKLVKDVIEKRDNPIGKSDERHVYRVLQCQERELPQMVSTVSDGWRFEQLLNIGSHYQYGNDDQAEFLFIVSRDIQPNPTDKVVEPTDRAKVLQQIGLRM